MARLWVVDPGIKSAFSLWSLETGKLENIGRKKFIVEDDEQLTEVVYRDACDIFQRNAIGGDELIVEDGYVGVSAYSSLHLQTIRAAWECAAMSCGVSVRKRLHPKKWQKAIGVRNQAKRSEVKEVVKMYVSKVFGEALVDEITQDQVDALAMGAVVIATRY